VNVVGEEEEGSTASCYSYYNGLIYKSLTFSVLLTVVGSGFGPRAIVPRSYLITPRGATRFQVFYTKGEQDVGLT